MHPTVLTGKEWVALFCEVVVKGGITFEDPSVSMLRGDLAMLMHHCFSCLHRTEVPIMQLIVHASTCRYFSTGCVACHSAPFEVLLPSLSQVHPLDGYVLVEKMGA